MADVSKGRALFSEVHWSVGLFFASFEVALGHEGSLEFFCCYRRPKVDPAMLCFSIPRLCLHVRRMIWGVFLKAARISACCSRSRYFSKVMVDVNACERHVNIIAGCCC
jgi:hypothetical protein